MIQVIWFFYFFTDFCNFIFVNLIFVIDALLTCVFFPVSWGLAYWLKARVRLRRWGTARYLLVRVVDDNHFRPRPRVVLRHWKFLWSWNALLIEGQFILIISDGTGGVSVIILTSLVVYVFFVQVLGQLHASTHVSWMFTVFLVMYVLWQSLPPIDQE